MSKLFDLSKFNPRAVDAIRNLSVSLEGEDMEVSRSLMAVGHAARPSGDYISKKLAEY